jgi:hypothetical protein
MRGTVRKDEEGNFIVVYHKECVEDSDVVIRVYCNLMPGFYTLFKDGDNIEFELIEFAREDGTFSSYARPYLKVNPHIEKIIDTNEDGETDMGDKLVAMSKTLRSQIYYRITNDGSSFGCGLAMRNAESIEELFDDYALKLLEYYQKNMFNGKLAGLGKEEILDKYKKKKGL